MRLVVMLFHRHADKQRGKHRKNKSLQKSDQQLKHVHEQHEGYGNRRDRQTFENKDQRDQAQHDDVPGRNVGEQTHQKRERL